MSVHVPTGIEEMVTRLLRFPVLQAEVLFRESLGAEVRPGLEGRIVGDIARRQHLGVAKYAQTLAENPAVFAERAAHAYEEALDLSNYLRWAMECADVPWKQLALMRSLLDASLRSAAQLRAFVELADAQEGGVA